VTELVTSVARAGGVVAVSDGQIDVSASLYWPSDDWFEHALISDISEIITYVALAVSTGKTLTIEGITVDRVRSGLAPEINFLDAMDIPLRWEQDRLQIEPPDQVRSVDIEVTSVGIHSDHQPFFASMLLKGDRPARIREHVWNDRFGYARELRKLGANIHIGEGEIIVLPSRLHCARAHVVACDLRGAAALVIAAIARGGETTG
jgi:UDP-N-acetylglucosamine 1-carboxyvinyltransferase